MTRPLFPQLLQRFILLLLGVILIVGVAFVAGVSTSSARWSDRVGERLEQLVARELRGVAEQNAEPSSADIERALRAVLVPGVFVRVYGESGEFRFGFQAGDVVAPNRRTPQRRAESIRIPGFPRSNPQPLIPERLPPGRLAEFRPVEAPSGRRLLFFIARSEGFLMDETNRIMFRSVLVALVIGAAAAMLLSTLGAYGLSRRLSRSTTAISRALSRVAAGERDVSIDRGRVTELNQIAADTEHLQSVLDQEEQLRARWAQDVAHDLRTPVTALRAQLEGVRDGVLSSGPERIDTMLLQLHRVERLVDSLNELTRIESPDTDLPIRPMAARKLASYICDVTQSMLDGDAAGSACESSALDGNIEADRELIARACTNLVDNALRYRESETPVRVTLERNGDAFCIRVRNSGVLPKRPDQLFERLARGEQSRTGPGSGLGLTIVRAIARRHGGSASLIQADADTVEALLRLPMA